MTHRPGQNLEDHNYETTARCDACGKERKGTMLHAHDAGGWAVPVLFLCKRHHKPNVFWKSVRFITRISKRAWWHIKTTRAEKQRIKERKAKFRKRLEEIKARRKVVVQPTDFEYNACIESHH